MRSNVCISKYAIVLEPYKAIYILVPKAGTSSMKAFCMALLSIPYTYRTLHTVPLPYISNEEVTNRKYKNYFKFTFVRDPWDRIVSCYEDKVKDKNLTPEYNGDIFPSFKKYYSISKSTTFEEFVSIISKIPDIKSNTHFISQHYLLTLNKDNIFIPNYVGKLESINTEFKIIKSKLKVKEELNHLHRLTTDKDIYRDYYTSATKELISKRYSEDIRIFNYKF